MVGWEQATFGSNAHLVLGVVFEETLDATTGELRIATNC